MGAVDPVRGDRGDFGAEPGADPGEYGDGRRFHDAGGDGEVRGQGEATAAMMADAVVIGLALLAIGSIWRLRSVSGIPDVGDPFDVAAARRSIDLPDAENAYAFYAEARRKFTKVPASMAKIDLDVLTWSKAGQAVRDFVEQNRPAMERWRRGSERPDALHHQPGELQIDTILPPVQDMGGPLVLERNRRAALIVRLAAELYRRENGRPPATAGALIGLDLGELPEGIAASNPIPEVKD